MDDSPQDVYAKCLPSNCGYPLWFPEPTNTLPSSYRQDGLQIGDVGFISQMGTFNVLCNISYGPNHALHQRPGVSFSFNPIALDIDHDIIVMSNAVPRDYIITSPGINQPNPISQRGHYEFTSSSTKGAILILPDGATSHDLPANERFRKVAIENAFEWYQIARERYGDSISNNSLYLITGFYKARSWSLASFHDATTTEPRHIWVVPREGEGTTAGRDWKCTFPVDYRDGPGLAHNGSDNQTVFIRGFKIAIRDDVVGWLSQKPEIQPVPAVRPRQGPCGCASFLMRPFVKNNPSKRRRGANGGADVNHVPGLSQPFHPSDTINRYLLNKDPDALVAVTHDSEWMTLIDTGKLTPEELTEADRLEELLSENYSLVSRPENNAVYLQGKSEDVSNSVFIDARGRTLYEAAVVSSKSEGFWYPKPSTGNFQVVITRIRAEDVVAGLKRMPVGFYILVRFDDTKLRTENKPVRLHDRIVEWDDRIQLPSEPSAKVELSVCASFEFSPILGNGEVLRTVEICVGELIDNTHIATFPPAEGKPGSSCSSLLLTIERRHSDELGTASDHDEDSDWEESSELAQLTDQGHDALLRYRADPRKENVTVSIGYFEHALSICPIGHHCHAAALCNLAMAHFINCRIDRDSMELSTAISYYREALKLRHVGPDRPATLLRLAEVLLYRYGKLGLEEFPGEIMEFASEVQANCSVNSHERRAADLALQTYALYKATNSGGLPDIDRLIPALRQAVEDIPHDYFDKLQRLTNLSIALRIRYEFYGDRGDLDESIATHEEAMRLTACGLDSPTYTHTRFLKEWAKATLAGGSWKDALVTASSVSISVAVPRFTIYRIICEYLETIDRITDASECFRQMVDEMVEQANAPDELVQWALGKLEGLGDTAMSAEQHGVAISQYSVALSLNPAAPQGLFIKRSKAYIARGLWEDALNDANKVIALDPLSPWGYERKHAALHGAGRYEDATGTFETMLLKISQSPDPEIRERYHEYVNSEQTKAAIRMAIQNAIRESPLVLVNTDSGRLLDKSGQAYSFESQPIFWELISSMSRHIDYARIEREVAEYYRYATFSHKWEDNEPMFEKVIHIVVYDLEESLTHDKLQMFCKVVRDSGFHWAWSDTCCINKADHYVLQEALVSMFKWYEGSAVTIVFLRDVRSPSKRGDLVRSIWNTRAWSLQEYHASKVVRFYTEDWSPYLNLDIPNHKESPEIISEMEEATGVSARALMALRPGLDDIREKLRLASTRQTVRVEDAAYSLLGIFSLSLPVVYGEGDKALGRFLAQLLTSSGDTSILAWTGRSGSFNSCLPASIAVFNEVPTTHIPLTLEPVEMDGILARLWSSSLNFTSLIRLYDRLHDLPVPSFVGQRMKLPCLNFKLGPLSASRSKSGYVFRAQTAVGVVEIKTQDDLSRFGSLYLVHPWIDFLLDRQPIGSIIETMPEEEMDDQSSSIGELPLFPGPSGIASAAPQTRAARLVSRLWRPFGGRTTTFPPDVATLRPPSSLSETDKQTRALRVITRLRQPFGALLLTPNLGNVAAYRRVAAESLITVQVAEITPTILNKLVDSVRTLDVL